jgi:hypothetical protein
MRRRIAFAAALGAVALLGSAGPALAFLPRVDVGVGGGPMPKSPGLGAGTVPGVKIDVLGLSGRTLTGGAAISEPAPDPARTGAMTTGK